MINFVTEMIGEGKYPEDICEELLSFCLAPICQMGGLGGDNMSIIIVCFLHGQPYANLVERCRKHHSKKKGTMTNEPLDRLTADKPFSDVSSLSATGLVSAHGNEANSSSSSPTSSPSSSPRSSTEDKFDALKAEDNAEKSSSSLSCQKESTGDNAEESLNAPSTTTEDDDEITSSQEQLSKKIKSETEKNTTELSATKDSNTATSNNNNDVNVSNSE